MEPNACLLSKEVYTDGVDRSKIVRSWNTASIVLFVITLLVLGSLIYLFYIRSKLSKEEQSKYWKYSQEKNKEPSEESSKNQTNPNVNHKKSSSDNKRRVSDRDVSNKRNLTEKGENRRAYELYKKY